MKNGMFQFRSYVICVKSKMILLINFSLTKDAQ